MAWTKSIVVVDEGVPVHDEMAVIETMMRRCDFRRDVEVVRGPLDILDHSAPSIAAGSKIGFDATTRMPGEETGEVGLEPPALPDDDQCAAAWAAGATLPKSGLGRLAIVTANREHAHAGLAAILDVWTRLDPDNPAADFVIARARNRRDSPTRAILQEMDEKLKKERRRGRRRPSSDA